MSNKLRHGFWGNLSSAKLSAALLVASSLSLTGLSDLTAAVMAQTTGNDSMGIVSVPSSGAASGQSTSAASSAATSAATAPASADATTATATGTAAPAETSGLWTAPKYAVKEIPQTKPTTKPTGTTGATGTSAAATPAPVATSNSTIYDEKSAKDFADNVTMPQYVWTRQDKKTKGQKADALNASKEMAAYNRLLVEKFVAKMVVPNSATLVESSQSKYMYLVSFTIDARGKISHINSEKAYGSFTAVNLADDDENKAMTTSITQALGKCSPLAVPPAGIAPWYMLLRFEPNTGKVYVANLNTI